MDFDPRYVDVDFLKEPRYVFGDKTGPDFARGYAAYEDSTPDIPESQWPGLAEKLEHENAGMENLITRIFNQKQEGSCVGNATTQQNEIEQAVQFGKDRVVQLSAISLYKRIGSGPMSGANVSDALNEVTARGILPLDTPANRARFGDHVMPHTGFYTPFPAGWEKTAALFKGGEYSVVRSVAGLITALFNGHPVVVGRAGHSICYVRPVFKNGSLSVIYANSWSEDWGMGLGGFKGGFGVDSLSMIRSAAGWAFAMRSIVVPN